MDITETIYIPLLDEGTDVARPTQGVSMGAGIFRVLPTPDYNSESETWEFPPGCTVICGKREISVGEVLMAERLFSDR